MNDMPVMIADSCAAFVAQIESHRGYLLRTARLKLRDATDAEDVVQDTVIAAWNGRAGFRGQSMLRTWLVGILNHKIVDLIRERQRRPSVAFDEFAEFQDAEERIGENGLAWAPINEGVAVAYERRQLCERMLLELEVFSPKAARIFVLREIDGEDTGAICRRLKVSSANCYVLLHRARQFLRGRSKFLMAAA